MSKETAPIAPIQPKIVKRMMNRYAFGLLTLAVIVGAYQALKTCGKDIDLPLQVDTAGMVAAVQLQDRGSKVVVIGPDGTIRSVPEGKEGVVERDAVWRPDGNRVFFVANRDTEAFSVYRWNLGSDKVELRSETKANQSQPTFGAPGSDRANDAVLLLAGGKVLELDTVTGRTLQVLPPVPKEIGGGEEGAKDQIEALYKTFGTSFRAAQWTFDKRFVVAVMRREDGNETLIVQELGEVRPLPVVAGKKIDFTISPTSDQIVFTVLDYMWIDPAQAPPEFIKNGVATTPYRHGLFLLDPTKPAAEANVPVMASKQDDVAFGQPAFSPDGSMIALVGGTYKGEGDLETKGLMVLPAEAGGGQAMSLVIQGAVREPSWGPDNETIVYVLPQGGRRALHSIKKDGSDPKNLTGDKGDFAWPRMSPQVRAGS